MNPLYPPDKVLVSKQNPIRYVLSPNDSYIDIYTKEERDCILEKYKTPNLFNGVCIRLDSLVDGVASISPVTFFDFLCCNIAGIYNKDEIAYGRLKPYLDRYGKLDSFEKVISIRQLPNILGTSVLLSDVNDTYLVVERNTKVSVGSGLFACSSAGSLSVEDMGSSNPALACAKRELLEELNLSCELYSLGLIMPKQKMQPIALFNGKVDRCWKDLLAHMVNACDFSKENSRLLAIPRRDLMSFISNYTTTDVASYHMYITASGGKDVWKKESKRFINVNDYYLY